MRRLSSILLTGLLLMAAPVHAAYNNVQSIMTSTEVATGAPVSVTVTNNLHNTSGYLVVKTENKAASASLVVTVLNVTASGNFLICTSTAITTDTTTIIMLGSTATAADGVTDVCGFAMSRSLIFTFTTSGGSADFDVTADVEWLATTAIGRPVQDHVIASFYTNDGAIDTADNSDCMLEGSDADSIAACSTSTNFVDQIVPIGSTLYIATLDTPAS